MPPVPTGDSIASPMEGVYCRKNRPNAFPRTFRAAWPQKFSTQWKIFCGFFHTMENKFPHCGKKRPNFPHNGKTFRRFSTQWKEFVHNVENSEFRLFSGVLGCSLGAVERSKRRPLSIVERDRPKRPGKRRPPQAVSALSRARLGCGVGSGRFLVARSGISRALRCEGGVAGVADFIWGLLKNVRGLRDHTTEGRRPDPSPERACAVGTVPGAVQSSRLAG